MSDFDRFEAMSFDCYGTLIDWETGLANALRPWAARNGVGLDDEALIAAHGRYETHVQDDMPGALYPIVLGETLRRIGAELGAEVTDDDAAAYGQSVKDWPAFPDSAAALSRLATRFKLIIVSNIDRASFAASRPRLGVDFAAVVTAEDVGSYKPRLGHFDRLFEELDATGSRARPSGARRREPVPRSSAGRRARHSVGVDPPPSRQGRRRRDGDSVG